MKSLLLHLSLLFGTITRMDAAIDSKLRLVNTADKPILVYYTTDGQIAVSYQVTDIPPHNAFHEFKDADTTRGYQRGLMKDNPNYIAPCGEIAASMGMGQWEGHIADGKLRIYLFDPETVLANDWDKLWINKKWTKAYAFTIEQVEARNWVIRL
jgi:hypothetical protein